MPEVKVEINGRAYFVACDDGEQERIRELGGYLNAVVRNLVDKIDPDAAPVADSQLLVMAGLTIADELSETYEKLESAAPAGEAAAARALDDMAARLETIAARLEGR